MAIDIPGIIMKGLGVGPDDVRNMIANVVKERDAMRAGFKNLADHFNGRLDTIEKQQAEILRHFEEANNGKRKPADRTISGQHSASADG